MSQQFTIGDQVRVASDEGLDVPTEAQDKIGIVTGYLYYEGKVIEYWVEGQGYPRFNAASCHIAPVYEVQYTVRNLGSGIPGRHVCTGCKRLFVKDEIFEIGSVLLPNDKYAVVNVHPNRECQDAAIIAVT